MQRGSVGAKKLRAGAILFGVLWLLLGCSAVFPQTAQENAWNILQKGLRDQNTNRRAAAVTALGLIRNDPKAIESAEGALNDKKPVVRAAAATALGQMDARSSIPLLKESLADKDNRVFFAAADSLLSWGDPAGYDVYYEILTGERKSGQNWIGEKKRLIADERAMVLLALGVGIGFAPYAGYGWMVWEELAKDYGTPVRINALKKLGNDPDPRIGEALIKAAFDKHWTVRVAALSAIARHGDPSFLGRIIPLMKDKKAPVRFAAAATVLRLSALVTMEGAAQMATRQ
jgi:HEAT repeat protein